ncbi:TPA: hypothetical protein ACF2DE_002790 [Clostridium perfringens]
MRNNDIYMDFSFNGKRLSSFNGVIHTTNNPFAMPLLPNQELKSETIPSVGEVFTGKVLGARRWSLDIFFKDILDQRDIADWLLTESESEFYFVGDSVKINCLCESTDDLEFFAEGNEFMGSFKVNFVAFDPYYRPINNETLEFTTFSQEIVFNNDGNRESFGEFDFTLNGLQNVKFRLNGNLFEVSEARDRLLINTEFHTCKDSEGNRRRSIVGNVAEFFYKLPLKSGRNTFSLVNGSINRLTIKCNSRYI